MRIPLNWLKDYIKVPTDQKLLTDKLTMSGHMLNKVEVKNKHVIIDLELRGNRADCYSILGIAREVSALFKSPVKYPKFYHPLKKVPQLKDVTLEVNSKTIKRVMLVTIKNIKITPSPKWLRERLVEYGIESINNIVDLSNYVMIETGQPLHTFDLEKLGKKLEIRPAKKGEHMITFAGRNVILTSEDLIFTNKKTVVTIAGVVGEKKHSISDTTKNILLEAANYDRASIRRTIHRQNLFTDAGIRHEKELDPNLVSNGIYRFLQLIDENGWGKIENQIVDYYPKKTAPWKLILNFGFLKNLSGIDIPQKHLKAILASLGFQVLKETKEFIEVVVPTHRTDVKLEEDLVEEVLRIYGYNQIPIQTLSLEIPTDITPEFIKQELDLRNNLVAIGFDEIISLPFVKENLHDLNTTLDNAKAIKIVNRPSPDLEILRMTLLPNLYEAAERLKNERGEEVRFFEIGKGYAKFKNKYIEKRKLGIIYWSIKQNDFYNFKGLINAFFEKINLNNTSMANERGINNLTSSYSIRVNNQIIGFGGRHKDYHYAEIDLDSILGKKSISQIKLWPKYPPQIEDLTFVLEERVKVGELITSIKNLQSLISNIELVDIFNEAYTFRVWYQDKSKTLNDKEVESIRNRIIKEVKEKFGGIIKN